MKNNSITLPIEIFDRRLSLLEVGVVAVTMSYPHQAKEILDKWDEDVMFNQTINQMMNRGMISVKNDELVLNIDGEPEHKNMKIETAMNELFERGICNDDNLPLIRDVLEEISNDFYHMGYEDGKVDSSEELKSFTAYGMQEDFE